MGCGGGNGGNGNDEPPERASPEVPSGEKTANHEILVPSSVSVEKLSGDVDGYMLYSGTPQGSGSAKSFSSSGSLSKALLSSRDVAGFFVERAVSNGEQNAAEVLGNLATKITQRYSSFTSTGAQIIPGLSASFSSYALNVGALMKPTQLATELLSDIGLNKEGGELINLPVVLDVEPYATEFTVLIGVVYFSETDVVVLASVVPTNLAGTYSTVTSTITNGTIVSPKADAQKSPGSDLYTVQGGSGKADFLFVVDNSISMGGEQQAISDAANEFVNAITKSGLDYSIGTITTDSDTLRDANADGGFTTDLVEYQVDVKPGISGSFIETGIWFAERALQSQAAGDVVNGTVTDAGYPRQDASLSVVILSDEPSQYIYRSGSVVFDPKDNLFVQREYTVHAIIEPEFDEDSQYDDLALETGGSTADIGDTSTFAVIMNNIAREAGGATSAFVLAETPISSTIEVTVNGVAVANSSSNGWEYNVANNSILFNGTAIPGDGEEVKVEYSYFQ